MTERMTLRQWQWYYRDQMLVAVELHGYDTDLVFDAMSRMEVEPFTGYGVGQTVSNEYDKTALPDGTILQIGTPEQWHAFGVFVKQHGVWSAVLGELVRQSRGYSGTLLAVAGDTEVTQDWIHQEPTDADDQRVALFKGLAYRVGMKIKHEHGWCGDYERVVRERVGLDRETLRITQQADRNIGDVVYPSEAASLPVGTLLARSDNNAARSAWYLRVSNPPSAGGTVYLMGWGGHATNYARNMTVAAFLGGDGDWHGANLPLNDERLWNLLPPGTRFQYQDSEYVMCLAHKASARGGDVTREGNYSQRDFGSALSTCEVLSIPHPEGQS